LIRLDKATKGWGSFHIPDDIFEDMRQLLAIDNHKYSNGHQYGDGPNWRMRSIREALIRVGLSSDILRHGISREVFAMPLASNWREYLCGETDDCLLNRPTVAEIAEAAIKRWVLPRAERCPDWIKWGPTDRAQLFEQLLEGQMASLA
jgi:hypothetical protein